MMSSEWAWWDRKTCFQYKISYSVTERVKVTEFNNLQTVTKQNKTIKKSGFFGKLFRVNSILFFNISWDKGWGVEKKPFIWYVHRWSRSRNTDHFLKSSKNHLIQFPPLVCTLKGCGDECTIWENTRDWTNTFFNSFRQWLVSQLRCF